MPHDLHVPPVDVIAVTVVATVEAANVPPRVRLNVTGFVPHTSEARP